MKDYRQFIKQLPHNTIVCALGDFNPPTTAHELLIKTVQVVSEQRKSDHVVFTSNSESLQEDKKHQFLKMMFPKTTFMSLGESFFSTVVKKLNEKYKNIIIIAGADQFDEFKNLKESSNVEIISIGTKDPDADFPKMKQYATKGIYEDFKKLLPSTIRDIDGKRLMNEMRVGMQLDPIKEQLNLVKDKLREQYFRGEIFNVGQLVESGGQHYEIVKRGSNHLLLKDQAGELVSKWITDVKEIKEGTIQPNGTDKIDTNAPEQSSNKQDAKPKGKVKGFLTFYNYDDKTKTVNEWVVKHDGVDDNHPDEDARKLFAGKKDVINHLTKYKDSAEKHAKLLKDKGFKNVRIEEQLTEVSDQTLDKAWHARYQQANTAERGSPEWHKAHKSMGKIGDVMKKRISNKLMHMAKHDPEAYKKSAVASADQDRKRGWSTESYELQEGKMGQIHADIEDHLGKHLADYKTHGGAEHLANQVSKTHEHIAKLHGLEKKHAVSLVNQYVDSKLNEETIDQQDDRKKQLKRFKDQAAGLTQDRPGVSTETTPAVDPFFKEEFELSDSEIESMIEEVSEEELLALDEHTEWDLVYEDTEEVIPPHPDEGKLDLMEVLSRQERIKGKIRLRKSQAKRSRSTKINIHRHADTKTINKRARRLAIKMIKKRMLRGRNPAKVSVGDKERIEKSIHKNKALVDRVAQKLIVRVRKVEKSRLSGGKVKKGSAPAVF